MVEQGRFRKELFFRLNLVNLRLPPLRERRADIPLLATHFLRRVEKETGVRYTFSEESLSLIADYDWPGNVSELENVIERTCAISIGPVLQVDDLPKQLQDFAIERTKFDAPEAVSEPVAGDPGRTKDETAIVPIAEIEKRVILKTVRLLKGDKLLAAKLLGIGKTTLYRKLKDYGSGTGEFPTLPAVIDCDVDDGKPQADFQAS